MKKTSNSYHYSFLEQRNMTRKATFQTFRDLWSDITIVDEKLKSIEKNNSSSKQPKYKPQIISEIQPKNTRLDILLGKLNQNRVSLFNKDHQLYQKKQMNLLSPNQLRNDKFQSIQPISFSQKYQTDKIKNLSNKFLNLYSDQPYKTFIVKRLFKQLNDIIKT